MEASTCTSQFKSADIDEKCIRKEKPEDLVMALAEAKADAILSNLQTISNQEKDDEQTILTAADTAEAILQGLPIDEYVKDAEPTLLITCDQVYFHTIPDEIIEKLIEEGTVLYVAGGLITEHPLILPFIKQVVGTIDSVMGLPKALTEKLIKEAL
ncbi:hypothetical protein ACB092_01G052100 [Castanea dentata]